jgi:outer membrane biosynthesis protein TonB
VQSLGQDKKRIPVYASDKVSTLEEISIFTYDEDMPLKEVFQLMYEKLEAKEAISHKSSPDELKAFMDKVLPNYDKERVYVSDIKKLIQWYNILLSENLISIEKEEEEEEKKPAVKQEKEKKEAKEKKEVPKEKKTEKKETEKKPKPKAKAADKK